jgi:aryl carrier-like protein
MPTVAERRSQIVDDAVGLIQAGLDTLGAMKVELEELQPNLARFDGTSRYEMVTEAVDTLSEAIGEIESAKDSALDIDFGW